MMSGSRTLRQFISFTAGVAILILVLSAQRACPESDSRSERDIIDYTFRTHDAGNLAMCISNHGFLGNNFSTRDASMEYPRGSEVDHMVRGGIWIGGITDNFETLVTTGAHDGYWGTYSRPTEWVPVGIPDDELELGWIRERSTLPENPGYDPVNAVSEQDFVTAFLDTLSRPHQPVSGNADVFHYASGLRIEQETYAWSFEPLDAILFMRWTLVPDRILNGTTFSLYAELTSGWKGRYPEGSGWPPASANWFHHHLLYWVDDMPEYADWQEEPFNLVAEHHYTYDSGHAPQHAGIKFLGAEYRPVLGEWENSNPDISWRWWDWSPSNYDRDNDSEKYLLMTTPGIDDWTQITPSVGSDGNSPEQLFNIGAWNLEPGDTLRIHAAFLAGDSFGDLVENAQHAQQTYEEGYTPTNTNTPTLLNDFTIFIEPGCVTASWELEQDSDCPDFRLEAFSAAGSREVPFDQVSPGNFLAEDRAPELIEGGTFDYRLHSRAEGGDWMLMDTKKVTVETVHLATGLECASPNPFNPRTILRFTLESRQWVRLSIYAVTGQELAVVADGIHERGRHELVWRGRDSRGRELAGGVYLLRMETAGRAETGKLVLLR